MEHLRQRPRARPWRRPGRASLLNIGSGNAPDYDAPGAGSVVITGGQVNAFGGVTVGNVYNQGGTGLLSLQGGLLDLTSGTAGSFGGLILVGSGGTLVTSSGTLENVAQNPWQCHDQRPRPPAARRCR